MKTIESTGKTVEEAIQKGLVELDLSFDEAVIDILDEGGKGILSLFGGKVARVKISEKFSHSTRAVSFLTNVTMLMGVPDPGFAIAEGDREIKIHVQGENMGALIGHRGETLDALQMLTSLVVNHHNGGVEEEYCRVSIDVGNYRNKREETLKSLASRLAEKAIRTGRRVALEPMNSYERRIIHSSLTDVEGVVTFSEGEGSDRRVIIGLK